MSTTEEFIKACHDGDIELAGRLLPRADVNGANGTGQGALLTPFPDVIAFLLSNGADPDVHFDENGATALASLSHSRKAECVRRLLAGGANPDKGREESGETPLHHAFAADSAVVRALLEAGADPNRNAQEGVLSFNYGGDVRVRGETPMHRAAAHASIEVIQQLLDAGADCTVLDSNGDSPLTWALLHLRQKPILRLVSYGEHRIS